MKRNSPESSHSRPERQQESRIEGVKTIGIISTPIIWPVKQRHPRFSESSADENLERKNTYGLFRPTVSTSSASEETSNGTLAAFTENIDLDNTVMNQLPNENILNDSRVSSDGTYDAADNVGDHSVDAAVPLLQNRSLTAEEEQTLADGLHYADSESTFRLPISRSTAYEHREEALWISSSNDTLNFMHINDVLKPDSWNETVFYHHITSDIKEEKYHSLSSLSIPPMKEKPLLQKSRLDLLDFEPQNAYSEIIEGDTNRKYFSMLAANSEFKFTTSMYIKEHYSGGFTKLTSVDVPHTNPATSNNMKKTYIEIMPDSQLMSSVTGYSREQLMSALPVGASWTNSEFKHVVATLPAYEQSLVDMSLESDSILMSNADYWSNYLKQSAYIQKKPSETLRRMVLENNLDAFHSKSEEPGFPILEPENINGAGVSWKPGYLDFSTKYLDISPSLTSSFWTVSYHLKVFPGESSKNQLVSFNKLLSNPTEMLPSISSPTKSDSISEQTSTIRLLDHRTEEMNFSSHATASERQIFSLLNPGLSRRISESNDKTISQLQSTVNFANLTVSSSSELYFDFLFPSLEAPLHHHSVQISPFDKALVNSMEKLMFYHSLHKQGGADVISHRTNVTVLNNTQQLASVLITHSGMQPSCSKDSQTVCLVNTLVNSLVNSTRTRGLLQFESVLKNDTITNTGDNTRSEVQIDPGFFIKRNSSVSSDLLITTLSLELKQPFHSDSKFRVTVPPNSYSTPPLPQGLQNHLDTISPSLTPGWDVEELRLPTTERARSLLTVSNGKNSIENQDNSIRYSPRAGEQEIVGDNNEKQNPAVLISTNKSRLSDQNLEGEVYGSFSKHREGMSSLNIFSTPILDFENTDYRRFSSLLVSSRTAIINDVIPLPSSYSGITIQHKEATLNHSLMTPGAAIHDSHMHSRMQISPVMYHQSSVLSHVHSLSNLSSETSQNTTLYPPLNQLTRSPTVILSCTFTELGCLCRPEINYSMSSY